MKSNFSFLKNGAIAVSQPRRVAAINLARRVSEELDVSFGKDVGYTIRFDDFSEPTTKIRYITDGCLVREFISDPTLSRYSVVMLDEAHERSINSDILFGLCKQLLMKRPELRLIVSSATLDIDHFHDFYPEAAVLTITGRMYPVAVFHSKSELAETQDEAIMRSLKTFQQIHKREPGHVLLFLPGQAEIEKAAQLVEDWYEEASHQDASLPPLRVLPLYASLPAELQARVFDSVPQGTRKLIIATNIAETSLTIPGIRYVIDPGFTREKRYDANTGIDFLQTTKISQISAQQRAGRAGRTGPGKCFRLYNSNVYNMMVQNPEPEIRRASLLSTMLYLKTVGIDDVLAFDYLDAPSSESMSIALKQLFIMGALDEEGHVTPLGKRLSSLPLDPQLSKMILVGCSEGCVDEAMIISSMLSVDRVFYSFSPRQVASERCQRIIRRQKRLMSELGDHFTYLNMYDNKVPLS